MSPVINDDRERVEIAPPVEITREQVMEATRALGLEPNSVTRIILDPGRVEVEELAACPVRPCETAPRTKRKVSWSVQVAI